MPKRLPLAVLAALTIVGGTGSAAIAAPHPKMIVHQHPKMNDPAARTNGTSWA